MSSGGIPTVSIKEKSGSYLVMTSKQARKTLIGGNVLFGWTFLVWNYSGCGVIATIDGSNAICTDECT